MDFVNHDNQGQLFLEWIESHGFEVIVFDMDRTMSTAHCGSGLKRTDMSDFISRASGDFVTAVNMLKTQNFRCAVATGSDPAEYDLPGQCRETHILGPDLATALITHHCPDALDMFQVMVGYDSRLHLKDNDKDNEEVNNTGKRYHMRLIQQHYDVPFHKMVIFDDSRSSLRNEDGWVGVKVDPVAGFSFADLPSSLPLYKAAFGYCDDTMTLPTNDINATVTLYNHIFGMQRVGGKRPEEGEDEDEDKDKEKNEGGLCGRTDQQSVVLERDGVQLGFAMNGGDPTNTGAALLVSDIYRARSEMLSRGMEIQNWRVQERGGTQLQEFFVGAPDGLCFCFHMPL